MATPGWSPCRGANEQRVPAFWGLPIKGSSTAVSKAPRLEELRSPSVYEMATRRDPQNANALASTTVALSVVVVQPLTMAVDLSLAVDHRVAV